MPQVLVWKCKNTGNLFEDRGDYLTHLKRLARTRSDEKKRKAVRDHMESIFRTMRNDCGSPEEIEEYIKNNWTAFLENSRRDTGVSRKKKQPSLLGVKITIYEKATTHSNSHSAPLGEKTDFCKPVKLPAFVGSIWFSLSSDTDAFSSDLFSRTGLNTGTGGGGSKNQSYELVLWEKDWPKMTHNREMANVVKKLSME